MMEDLKKNYEKKETNRTFQGVELDLKLLLDTHKKLASGNNVEPKVVNTLPLGGIANILCQSELFDNAMERVKVLRNQNFEIKLRLASLKNWILKLNDKVHKTSDKIETFRGSEDPAHLRHQLENVHGEIQSLKETI